MACVYIIVCMCVCAWQMVAHICLIALAAKGLTLRSKADGAQLCNHLSTRSKHIIISYHINDTACKALCHSLFARSMVIV